jgi:hypothetical protein
MYAGWAGSSGKVPAELSDAWLCKEAQLVSLKLLKPGVT